MNGFSIYQHHLIFLLVDPSFFFFFFLPPKNTIATTDLAVQNFNYFPLSIAVEARKFKDEL
jgi:hypothetical protein